MKYMYRIVILALVVVSMAVLITTPVVQLSGKSTLAQVAGLVGQLTGSEEINEKIEANDGEIPDRLKEEISIYNILVPSSNEVVNTIMAFIENSDMTAENEALDKLIGPAVALIISLAAVFVFAVATCVMSFMKNNRKVIYSAVWAIVSCFSVNYSFETIAGLFLSEDITIGSILQSEWGNAIMEIDKFELSNAFQIVPCIFAAMIVFTFLYNYTLPEKEKKVRKEMLGE